MSTSRSFEAFAFVVCAASLVDLATDTPWQTDHWMGPFFQLTPATQVTSALCAAALAFFAIFLLMGRFGTERDLEGVWIRLVAVLLAVSMVYAVVWARVFVAPSYRLPWIGMVVAAPLFVGVSAWRRWPPMYATGVVVVVGVILRLIVFARFSIDEGADMLPLTRGALGNLVRGANPYTYYDLPDPAPLTYFPLTWLAYLPPYLGRIDLRWTNILAELAILAAIVYAGRPSRNSTEAVDPKSEGAAQSKNAVHRGLFAYGFVFLLPSSIYFDRITTAPVAWALVAWCVVLLARNSAYDRVMLGVTAAATPLAAVLVPFACVLWWRQHSFSALRRGLRAGLVTSVILAPFILWSPRGFIDGAVLWFNDISRYPAFNWQDCQRWQRYVGFGGLFWRVGIERALAPIQWLLVAAITALFARSRGRRLASHVAAAFVAFMLFNSVHWPYFYQPAIFVALLAIVTAESAAPEKAARDDGFRAPRAWVG